MNGNLVVTTKYMTNMLHLHKHLLSYLCPSSLGGFLGGDLMLETMEDRQQYSCKAVLSLYLLFLITPSQVLHWKETNIIYPRELTIFG